MILIGNSESNTDDPECDTFPQQMRVQIPKLSKTHFI